jgi:prolyl-tRNA synthetase
MGIPHRIVVGERGLKTDTVEYANRQTGESSDLPIEGLDIHFRQIIDRELNS